MKTTDVLIGVGVAVAVVVVYKKFLAPSAVPISQTTGALGGLTAVVEAVKEAANAIGSLPMLHSVTSPIGVTPPATATDVPVTSPSQVQLGRSVNFTDVSKQLSFRGEAAVPVSGSAVVA